MAELVYRNGRFGAVQVPSGLPQSGLIPVDWDGTGRPTDAYQCVVGEDWIYDPDDVTNPLAQHVYRFTGSSWVDLNAPVVAQQRLASNFVVPVAITAVPDISITLNVPAGRIVLLEWTADIICDAYTSPGTVALVRLWADGVQPPSSGTCLLTALGLNTRATVSQRLAYTPAAGSHTYQLAASKTDAVNGYTLNANSTNLLAQLL